jgi:GAF domain-containing protein
VVKLPSQGETLVFNNNEIDYCLFLAMLSSIYTHGFDEALRMIESGVDQRDVLSFLAHTAEKASGPDTVASILLLDKNGLLRNGASPNLPADYLQAIDAIKPDANLGTCAAAAASGEVVITPSFYADNKWAELKHLPTALGFVGAWSMPIKTPDKILGTFGTYFRTQRKPSSEEIKGTGLLASAAAMVVMRQHATVV